MAEVLYQCMSDNVIVSCTIKSFYHETPAPPLYFFFFLNNTPPPKIYPLPLPDAFPIPMPPLQATEGGDWAPPADRPYGEPHGLRHRWGIGRAHLRFWVAGPTQGEARADRSGEQLDPEIGRAHV